MSRLLGAMKLKIREIVLVEERPFSSADFRQFEIAGQKYHMKDGTFRNNISKLRKSGAVELAFRSRPAFYTLTGKKFNRTMTLDHTGVPNAIINQSVLKAMPIYNWLKKQPMEKQSLHNIRLRFESAGLHSGNTSNLSFVGSNFTRALAPKSLNHTKSSVARCTTISFG